jgi:hypothetical protein
VSAIPAETLTILQQRFGPAAIARGEGPLGAAVWPSGIPMFDERLLPGGLPRGRISVLAGEERAGPSGRLTLLQAFIALASRTTQVAYVDLAGTLDPGFLADLGADLSAAIVLRPSAGRMGAGLAMGRAVVVAGIPWLAVALPARCPAPASDRWEHALTALVEAAHRARAVVCFGAAAPLPAPIAHASSLTLRCEARGWHEAYGDIAGLRVSIVTVKSKLGAPGASGTVLLRYPRAYAAAEVAGMPSVIEPSIDRNGADAAPFPAAVAG